MSAFALSIISPQGVALEAQVQSLIAPGEEGFLEILSGHAPIVVKLKKGAAVAAQDGQKKYFAVGPGVLEMDGRNRALLLSDYVFPAKTSQDIPVQLAKIK